MYVVVIAYEMVTLTQPLSLLIQITVLPGLYRDHMYSLKSHAGGFLRQGRQVAQPLANYFSAEMP